MQNTGLLSLALLTAGLTFTALKLPGGLTKTFSQRVANNKIAEALYSLLFIVALPLLYWFFTAWFVPDNNISTFFLWLAGVAVIFQIACTWVPERGGNMSVIHRILTGISGVALLPLVLIIATTQDIPLGLRHAAGVAFVLMLVLLIVALVNHKEFRYALLLQAGYYALFFAVVMLITYA